MADLQQARAVVEAQENAVEVPIFKPDGEPYLAEDGKSQCTISVLGSESKRYREAENRILHRMLKSQRRKRSADDIRNDQIEKAAAVTTRLFGWTDGDRALDASNPEDVRSLLSFDHILSQVEAGIVGHADFFRSSSSS